MYIQWKEYHSALKKKEILMHAITWMTLGCYIKWKKPVTERQILYLNNIHRVLILQDIKYFERRLQNNGGVNNATEPYA